MSTPRFSTNSKTSKKLKVSALQPQRVSSLSTRKIAAFISLMLILVVQFIGVAGYAQTMEPPKNGAPQGGGQNPEGNAANTDPTVRNPYIDAMGFVPQSNQSAEINVHGQQGTRIDGIQKNVDDIIRRDNPYGRNEQLSTLIFQGAEQANYAAQTDVNNLIDESLGTINDTYTGMHQFFKDDIVGNLFGNIGQLIGKWVSELINGWVADTVNFLAGFLRVFVLNPNVAVNGLNNSSNDGISPYIRQAADVMYGIAVDLLLLLFILAIWKYWIEAAWRGAGNLMGAVGRLIFTAGIMLAWPTLYAFEVQISNEMIKAIYFNTFDQVMMLDAALASAVRGGILAGIGGLTNAFAPLLGGVLAGPVGMTVGEVFAFAGLVIFLILGGILIAELVYILVLKAIQTALLTAQYMFAPIFLVFYATPSTENVATGFVRAFVETSLWTFVWVGLLKIMVIIMFSNFNPWGKILIAIGVLQMMIQVPTFLARAQISPMSDFISAGLITGGLFKMLGWMGKTASSRTGQLFDYHMNQKYGSRGTQGTTNNEMKNLPHESARPDMVNSLKDVSKTERDRMRQAGLKPSVTPGGGGATAGAGVPGTTPGTSPGLPNTLNKNQAAGAAAAAAALAKKPPGTPGAPGTGVPGTGVPGTGVPGTGVPGTGVPGVPGTGTGTPGLHTPASHTPTPGTPGAGTPVAPGTGTPVTPTPVTPVTPGAGTPGGPGTPTGTGTPGAPIKTTTPPITPGTTPPGTPPLKPTTPGVGTAAAAAAAAAAAGALLAGKQAGNVGMGGGQPPNKGAEAAAYVLGQDPSNPNFQGQGAGGGGVEPPGDEQYQMPVSTPKGWNEPNLFAVPYRKIIAQLKKVDGVGIHFDQKETGVMGDARNGATRINVGRGATDSQMAHGIMAASYAQEATNDVVGSDAARQAAIDTGADQPKGLFENLAANWYAATGSSFKQTVRAKERFAQQRYAVAAAGSTAYVSGQQGNAFTQYLRDKYGDWDDKMDAAATFILTDPEASESPWNPSIGPATDALVSAGIPISAQTRGAMQNSAVMAMHPSRRKLAVPAVLRYTFPEAKANYGHMDPAVFAQAHAEMAKALPQSEVEAAVALDTASGGADTSPTFAAPVMQLAAETGMDIPKCHAAMSAILPHAAQATGRLREGVNPRSLSTMRDLYYNIEPLQGETHQEAFATLSVGTVQGMKVANASGLDAKLFLNEDTASAAMNFMGNDLNNVYSPSAQGKMAVMRTVINDRSSPSSAQTLQAVFENVSQGGNIDRMDSVHIRAISNLHSAGGSRAVAPHVVEYAIATGNTDPSPGDINNLIRQAEPYKNGQVTDMRAAVHVGRLSDIGISPNRQTINMAIENAAMHNGERIDAQEMRAIIRIGENCRNPQSAPKVFEMFARDLAGDSGVANADSLPMGMLMTELARNVPNYASRIEHTAVNVQRSGRFSDSQMGDSGVVNLAVEAVNQSGTSGYTLPAINVAARLIGAENIQSINDTPIQVIEEYLDNGGSMDRMTLGDLNAGMAVYEARQVAIQEAQAATNVQGVAQCEMVRLSPKILGTVQQSQAFSARGPGGAHIDLNDAAQRAVWDRLVRMSMPRPPGAP